MSWRQTDAVTTVRSVPDEPRMLEGLAVPYGQVSLNTENGAEVFAPGAFRDSVDHWMGRQDGARMPFRPQHGAPAVGVVTHLEDTPDGVRFRASIFEREDGDRYLADQAAGLNGISVEFGPGEVAPRRIKGGVMLQRQARMHGIAGSLSPAYDAARISLRDMEEPMDTENKPAEPEAPPAQERETADEATRDQELTPTERSAQERKTVAEIRAPATITRAEAIYGPRSGQSYFADMLHAPEGDTAAAERLHRHKQLLTDQVAIMERAGEVLSSEIGGAYPNDYLPGLLTPRILKGRPMGGFFRRFPITDATPKIFPKVSTSTSVAAQAAEGTNPVASDFGTTAVSATPLLYGGFTDVARQVLDGADPSIDSMLMQDLTESYAQASEAVIVTAVEAGASASGQAITIATPYSGTVANIIAYQVARFMPAEAVMVPSALYQTLLTEEDTTGRALLPFVSPNNTQGSTAAGGQGARILDAGIFHSWGSTTNVVVTGRQTDYVIYESSLASFRYDQVAGPAEIRIGVWAYLVVGTRRGSLKVTATV